VYKRQEYTLGVGEYMLVAVNSSAMMSAFGKTALQWTSGALSNSGELVLLKNANGLTVDSVNYDDVAPWDSLADGYGPSLELCDPNADNSLGANWRAAIEFAAAIPNGDTIWATPLAGCTNPPVAGFTADDTLIMEGMSVNFTNASTGTIDTWEWTFEGGTPSSYTGETPPPVQYNIYGSYDVTLKVTNIAGQSTLVKTDYIMVDPIGIGNPSGQTFRIYPNPVQNGTFAIRFDHTGDYRVTLLSGMGIPVYNQEFNTPTAKISVPSLTPGVFFVRVTDLNSGTTGLQKLIIQ
jgi:PKD repeat protein